MKKRKLLGQHMLVDPAVLDAILDYADLDRSDIVFEIGTGEGLLTKEMCERAGKVISFEVDDRLVGNARRTLHMCSNLTLVNGDGFKGNCDFNVFVSNLPYSKSRVAIEWLAERDFERAIIMVQKEFAAKILAKDGSNYRAVSALAQYCFDIEQVANVNRDSFSPRPRVDSTLLKMSKKRKISKDVIKSLKLLFAFKGKKLNGVMRKFKIDVNIDGEERIENLSPEEAVRVAETIARKRLLQAI